VDAGEPIDAIRSVASFFVSRVDSKADDQLPAESPLRGRVALANAQAAYLRYGEELAGARWQRLADLGAAPQRPLWASTAAKNPSYRDVLYLEGLALPDSILTVPQPTLEAFADHGVPARPPSPDAVERALASVKTAVDLDSITAELEREGVEAFSDSYRDLLGCVAERASRLSAGAPTGLSV
jgi:transaldolase